jgi:WD40 repeat protein/tetratricopeptide (TPR) repeat protein
VPTPPPTEADVLQHNQASLDELRTVLRREAGEFSLTLAACNYHYLRQVILEDFQARGEIAVVRLPGRVPSLLAAMQTQLGDRIPAAVMVTGLEAQDDLPALLKGANLARDELRKALPCPVVLWVNETVRQQFMRLAPDLRSFSPSPITFTLPQAALIHALEAGTTQLFVNMLEYEGDRDLSGTTTIRLKGSALLRSELEFGLQDLTEQGWQPDPDLAASLDFLRGREAHSRLEMEAARSHYEASLAHWQDPTVQRQQRQGVPSALDREAVLLLHLGLWWRSMAVLQRATYQASLRQARRYFQDCLTIFREEDQRQRLARFIHVLAEVLQKQRDWDSLETLVVEGITLHQETHDPIRLARDHGFLAEVALIREDWLTAQQEAALALTLLEDAAREAELEPRRLLSKAVQVADRFQRGWYRFLLGQAQMHLKDPKVAIAYLEAARWETDPEVDLTLHRQVLEELIGQYFQQGQYWEAFDIKQALRQVEYRYNLRAFIGAGAVQPHSPMAMAQGLAPRNQAAVAAEIRASGRLPDVEALLHRLEDSQRQIIIIHGPSGVGKSSILTAGLLPALGTLYPAGHTTLPLLVQTYGTWPQTIAKALAAALTPWEGPPDPDAPLATDLATLQETLRLGVTRNNCFFVFLFDQFEEFFFEEKSPEERRSFYEFLQFCIDQPWVKVVLTLREDYLHHLLEVERVVNQVGPMTDLDLLSRAVRYPLGNFSPAAAEAVIRQLTEAAQYPLEEALIHRLVADLAAPLGSVRPIELQVVGAQLQRETIDTLAQYEALGDSPKETLVQRFLAYVVHDCGPPNERLAWVVLYLLTDEDRDQRLYRPLRTREELEYELALLEMPFDLAQLDLVMSILVGSGLVFAVPEEPEDRYQLVHDYLVSYVRQVQTPGLMAELQEARAAAEAAATAKKLAETERDSLAEANTVLTTAKEKAEKLVENALSQARQVRRWTAVGVVAAAVFAAGLGVTAMLARTQQRRAQLSTHLERTGLQVLRQSEPDIPKALMIATEASLTIKKDLKTDTSDYLAYSPILALQTTLDKWELHFILGHDSIASSVNFSPDSTKIGIGFVGGGILIWDIYSESLIRLPGHEGPILDISFSPNSTEVLSAADNGTVTVWNLQHVEFQDFEGHQDAVHSAGFSPDGNQIVTVSSDGTARIWDVNSGDHQVLEESESEIYSAQFSPVSPHIITGSRNGTVRIWNLENNQSDLLGRHESGVLDAEFSSDGTQIAIAFDDGTAKIWDLKSGRFEVLEGHQGRIFSVNFSSDNTQVITASIDSTARVWDLQSGKSQVLEGNQGFVNRASLSPDGTYALTNSWDGTVGGNTIMVWNLRTGDSQVLPAAFSYEASFSPNGRKIVTAGDTTQLWDVENGKPTVLKDQQGSIHKSQINPDGTRLLTVSSIGRVELLNTKDNTSRILEDSWDGPFPLNRFRASFSHDYNQVLTASQTGTARIWNLQSGEVEILEGHQGIITSAQFNFDGTQVLTASEDGTARVWDVQSGEGKILEVHQKPITNAQFNFDSTQVLTASYSDGMIRVWDMLSGNSKVIAGYQGRVDNVKFSPDSTRVIAEYTRDNALHVWEIDSGEKQVLEGHQHFISGMDFSPDGQQVVTSSNDGTTRLWDLNTGASRVLGGNQSLTYGANFSPDGQYVVAASSDRTAKVWDVKTGSSAVLQGHQGPVNRARFSPDGQRVITFSTDNTVRVWLLNGQQIAEYPGRGLAVNPQWTRVATVQDGDAFTPENAISIWRIDDIDNLLIRACQRLRFYLPYAPGLSDSDRALCDGIPTQLPDE